PKYQRVVVDAPATGHAISFFSIPRVLINTVPPGRLAKEAERMRLVLEDPEITTAALVSLPEEMPVNETVDLGAALRDRAHVQTSLVVLNGYVEERFTAGDIEALAAAPSLQRAATQHRAEAAASAAFRRRLAEAFELPVVAVPRLFTYPFGRGAVDSVAAALGARLKAIGWAPPRQTRRRIPRSPKLGRNERWWSALAQEALVRRRSRPALPSAPRCNSGARWSAPSIQRGAWRTPSALRSWATPKRASLPASSLPPACRPSLLCSR